MRRILVFVVMSLIPVFLPGQASPVDRLFDKYAGQDGYTTVYITKTISRQQTETHSASEAITKQAQEIM